MSRTREYNGGKKDAPRFRRWWYDGAMKEKTYQAQITGLMRSNGWRVHTVDDPRLVRPEGWPDIFAWKNGRAMAVEVKGDDGKLSREQKQTLDELGSIQGVDTYVWWPKDWEEAHMVIAGVPPPPPRIYSMPAKPSLQWWQERWKET